MRSNTVLIGGNMRLLVCYSRAIDVQLTQIGRLLKSAQTILQTCKFFPPENKKPHFKDLKCGFENQQCGLIESQ